jgi:tetratricopeptide (TPR) repeat protein
MIFINASAVAQDRALDLRDAGLREYYAGRFGKAETLLAQAVKAAASEGNRNLEGLVNDDIGDTEIAADRFQQAQEAYRRALTIFSGMPDKPFATAGTLEHLAAAYTQQGKYGEALKLLTQALKMLSLHPDVPESARLTAEIMNTEGIAYFHLGKLGKAQTRFENAMRARAAAGDSSAPADAQTQNGLGMVYLQRHQYTEAERAFLKAIDLTVRRVGPAHPDLTVTLEGLGAIYTEMGRYDKAAEQYERSLAILKGLDPPMHARMVRTLGLAGWNYRKQGDDRSAARAFQDAVALARLHEVKEPTLPGIFEAYADLVEKQGRRNDAQDLRADARRIRLTNALTLHVTGPQ